MEISKGLESVVDGLESVVEWSASPENALSSGTFLSENISRIIGSKPGCCDLKKGHIDYANMYVRLLGRIKAGKDACLLNLFKSKEVGHLCYGMLIEKGFISSKSPYKISVSDPACSSMASIQLFVYSKEFDGLGYLKILNRDYDHSVSISAMLPLEKIELTEKEDQITLQNRILYTLFASLLSHLTSVDKEGHILKASIMPPLQYIDPCKVLQVLREVVNSVIGAECVLRFASLEDAFKGFSNLTMEDMAEDISSDIIANALQSLFVAPGSLHILDKKFCLPVKKEVLFTESRTTAFCEYTYDPRSPKKQLSCSHECICKYPNMTIDVRNIYIGIGVAFSILRWFDASAVMPDNIKGVVAMAFDLYRHVEWLNKKSSKKLSFINQLTYQQLADILLDWNARYNLSLSDRFVQYVSSGYDPMLQGYALEELKKISPDLYKKILNSTKTWMLLKNLSNNYVRSCAHSYMKPLWEISHGRKIYKGYSDYVLKVKMAQWSA